MGKFQTFFKYFESFFRVPNLRVPFAQVLQQSDLQGLDLFDAGSAIQNQNAFVFF